MQELLKSVIGSCGGSAEHFSYWYQLGEVWGQGGHLHLRPPPPRSRNDYNPGFPNLSRTAFPAGWIILWWWGRAVPSIVGCLEISQASTHWILVITSGCENRNYLLTSPSVPCGAKSIPGWKTVNVVESHESGTRKSGFESQPYESQLCDLSGYTGACLLCL